MKIQFIPLSEDRLVELENSINYIKSRLKELSPQVHTVPEVCEKLQISRTTFHRWVEDKQMPLRVTKRGGRVYVTSEDLAEFISRKE